MTVYHLLFFISDATKTKSSHMDLAKFVLANVQKLKSMGITFQAVPINLPQYNDERLRETLVKKGIKSLPALIIRDRQNNHPDNIIYNCSKVKEHYQQLLRRLPQPKTTPNNVPANRVFDRDDYPSDVDQWMHKIAAESESDDSEDEDTITKQELDRRLRAAEGVRKKYERPVPKPKASKKSKKKNRNVEVEEPIRVPEPEPESEEDDRHDDRRQGNISFPEDLDDDPEPAVGKFNDDDAMMSKIGISRDKSMYDF